MHQGAPRAMEAKDVSVGGDPLGDDVGLLGERRHAAVAAMGLTLALAAILTLAVTMLVQSTRTTVVRVPVDVRSNGTIAIGSDFVVADSIVMRPERIADFAREFLEMRYAYDYRAGVSRILAARTFTEQAAAADLFPSADAIERLDAQHTEITIAVDSAPVRLLPDGIAEVTFYGRRDLRNLQYTDATGGARSAPFKQRVTIRRVKEDQSFPLGLAIVGSRGDLDS